MHRRETRLNGTLTVGKLDIGPASFHILHLSPRRQVQESRLNLKRISAHIYADSRPPRNV